MSQSNPLDLTRVNCVHVNPNFGNNAHVNRNFAFPSTGVHINPNFKGRNVLNGLSSNDSVYNSLSNVNAESEKLVQPRIHINPKMLQISPQTIEQPLVVNNPVVASKYVVHSKNKIVKASSPRSQVSPPVVSHVAANIKPIALKAVVKKPSYSLVRKTSKVQTHCTTRLSCDLKNKTVLNSTQIPPRSILTLRKYIKNSLNNKIWMLPDVSVNRNRNRFKICNIDSPKRKPTLPSGLLKYKLTPSKLRLSNNLTPRKSMSVVNSFAHTVHKTFTLVKPISSKLAPQFVVIRGEKYEVSDNILKKVISKTSSKPASTKPSPVKKINVSGKIYIRKSDNVFIVDNRQRNSVKKRKKMNITCPAYRRLGICVKYTEGKCPLVHDPKNVSICPKFLKGNCKIEDCYLSHQVSLEKMPTCKFFLDGCCVRDPCPYLHVKVNDNAKVCLQFLRGFCEASINCENKHINVCPDFYKYSKCEKTKCPYPHRKIDSKEIVMPSTSYSRKLKKSANVESKGGILSEEETDQKVCRYFEEKETALLNNENQKYNENVSENDDNVLYKGRPKLGDLPSFIALE